MVYFIPTTEKTSAEGLARLLRDNVWKLYSLPKSIISDRGPQFAAGLMRELNRMLGIKKQDINCYKLHLDHNSGNT